MVFGYWSDEDLEALRDTYVEAIASGNVEKSHQEEASRLVTDVNAELESRNPSQQSK